MTPVLRTSFVNAAEATAIKKRHSMHTCLGLTDTCMERLPHLGPNAIAGLDQLVAGSLDNTLASGTMLFRIVRCWT